MGVDYYVFKVKEFNYNVNLLFGVADILRNLDMLTHLTRCSSVAWSTLSNAADRSRSVKTAKLPESSASKMSDRTDRTLEHCGFSWVMSPICRLTVRQQVVILQVRYKLFGYKSLKPNLLWSSTSSNRSKNMHKRLLTHCSLFRLRRFPLLS